MANNDSKQNPGFDVRGFAGKITKGSKAAGIIISIVMIVLGILFFCRPLLTTIAIEAIVSIGFIIYGAYQIIMYIKAPAEFRNGATIALGILWIIIGVLLLCGGSIARIDIFAFLFGFMCMFTGIQRISASSAVKAAGGSSGWCVASGIINLILAIFFLVTPFAVTYMLGFILGIYLLIMGVVLLIDSASSKPIV